MAKAQADNSTVDEIWFNDAVMLLAAWGHSDADGNEIIRAALLDSAAPAAANVVSLPGRRP